MSDTNDPDNLDAAVRAGQLEETRQLAGSSAIGHAIVSAVVLVSFRDVAPLSYLAGLFVTVLMLSVATLTAVRCGRPSPGRSPSPDAVARGLRFSAAISLLAGLAWGTLPIALFVHSGANHRLIVIAIATGMLADAFLLAPIRTNVLLFAVPMVAGDEIAMALGHDRVSFGLAGLLVWYAAFVLWTTSHICRASIERIRNAIRVELRNQTIALLLRDFEADASDWLWEVDTTRRFRQVTERMAAALGRRTDALLRLTLDELLRDDPAAGRAILSCIDAAASFRDQTVRVIVAGEPRWWSLTGKPVSDDAGAIVGFRGIGSDVTARQHAAARITELATTDPLTGLSNRAVFEDALRRMCDEAVGKAAEGSTLLLIDLDGFKAINDVHGHPSGDALLKEAGRRLLSAAGPRASVVARLGGDEFAILVPGTGRSDAERVAAAAVASLRRPYGTDGRSLEVGASVGLARVPDDARDAEALLCCADQALYDAKLARRGLSVFEPAMGERARDRIALHAALREAVASRALTVHYQPVVRTADGAIDGVEALVRWTDPERGVVPPSAFIPIAEELGLIVALGRFVLETACADAATWPGQRRLAVNMSAAQLRDPSLLAVVKATLARTGVAPSRLELEITETVLLDADERTLDALQALRRLGVSIALDDFGIGYSSLSYLVRFPFTRLKIDRSFVAALDRSPESVAVVDAVIGLADRIGMDVTAEGVETQEQADALRQRRCTHLQGFLFSRALPAADIARLLTARVEEPVLA